MKLISAFILFLLPTSAIAGNTLIAPMINGLGVCESAINKGISDSNEALSYCESINETSASLIEKKLSLFGNQKSIDGKFQVGYVLSFPLLSYVDMKPNGDFKINKKNISYRLKLLKDSKLPVVLYFFSNHFSVSQNSHIEDMIAKLDSRSLMKLSDGTVPVDKYFASRIYPWSINSNQSLIDKVRKSTLTEILTQICEMSSSDKNKIWSVTTLGEVHYTFPNFFSGMGYKEKMKLTDYSMDSVERFRVYLIDKYKTINKLNDKLNSNFNSFDEIIPPSKDIMSDHLNNFFEHLNYESSGKLTLYGWADLGKNKSSKIKIYVDGTDVGYAEIGLNRMDVYQAIPTLETSDVGYRYYLDFRNMSHGIHSVDIVHEDSGELTLLKHLDISVMDRQQNTPKPVGKPVQFPVENKIRFWHDYPESLIAVYYNPLSEEFYNFRKNEVASEIYDYADIIRSSCIGKEKVFSHQIAPVLNGDWNEEKLAVEDSLKINDHYNIGFNAYGSSFYSDYTFDWLKKSKIDRYGIPEAHPMVNNAGIIKKAFLRHHDNGAVFVVPYYIDITPDSFEEDRNHAKFKIELDNKEYNSDVYFNAIYQIMNDN
ncbi:beta-galactosidase [Gilliamella sp. Pas-s25]|uniref:beta-galactosidase n=1 Tax=Gilliamella sp. Pas-s25 TaxID=2687310 RepID=UPI00135EC6D0|nr:beta-galactosidase [Gilliamella sp. Pas-s25]MWP62877.1 hypothetical protein [Gilliamella sp. Pas-s25]